jgi:hypothetical protein
MTMDELRGRRAVLVVGHPGHELRVHRWLELATPTVHVITDGSGRTGRSRVASTAAVLARAGCSQGAVFGACSDAAIYATILRGEAAPLLRIVETLAEAFQDADYVAADALEGFNPSHDFCRLMVNAALGRVARTIGNYDVLLDGDPRACPEHLRADAVELVLDDDALGRKIEAALGYPELRDETSRALAAYGADAFRVEMLRPVRDLREGVEALDEDPPYYERYGSEQVAAGHYREVIRYQAHVRPLARALWRGAEAADAAHETVNVTSS